MARKVIKGWKHGDKFEDRWFLFVFFADNEKHLNAIRYIERNYDSYVYVFHDDDLNDEGEPIKHHYHVIVHFNNYRNSHSVCDELGVEYNCCEPMLNKKDSFLYLLHKGYPTKKHYTLLDCCGKGSCWQTLHKFVALDDMTEDNRALTIYELIYSYDRYLKYTELFRKVCDEGLYSDFRRGASLYKELLIEHNIKYQFQDREDDD